MEPAPVGHLHRTWDATDGTVDDLRPRGDHWHYTFNHPQLEHTAWGAIGPLESGATPTVQSVAEDVFARYAAHLISDVSAARSLGLPLGAGVQVHEDVLRRLQTPSEQDVAFQLELPVLQNVSVREIVSVREHEAASFERFRASLSQAIRERLTESTSAAETAAEIARDIIGPALSEIASRLRVAERTLERKLGASVALGALTTTVGLLSGAPLIVGAGLAAVGTSIPAAHKYFDDRGSIELSDLYFLWQLGVAGGIHSH